VRYVGQEAGMLDSQQEREQNERKLILLVEDDAAHASMLYQVLKEETPHHVYYTSDGETAWRFLQQIRPHLLLLDYLLPRMNGLELYEKIRASKGLHDLPVLMVSAILTPEEAEQRGILLMKKPFELDEFLDAIERMLEA
jgi:DNA-binding response OmpR family regulator